MDKFTTHTGRVVPMLRANIDTDQIIPKQFLKRIERTGYGGFLFNDWRYLADGTPDPDFVLNLPRYEHASILVAGDNFGCGSSREHAAWALRDFSFRVVIAPSFGEIFYNNCLKNGLLPLRLDEETVKVLAAQAASVDGYKVCVDLENKIVTDESGLAVGFEIDEFRRSCLINGLDEIALTLQNEDQITAYEERTRAAARFGC